MRSLGIRHVALRVKDAQASKAFYIKILGMTVEWEPDEDNVYLTREGLDNLAIHKEDHDGDKKGSLDHFGVFVPEHQDVDEWYEHVKSNQVEIAKDIKTHRDGARSFYFYDIDRNVIQLISHPPVTERAKKDGQF